MIGVENPDHPLKPRRPRSREVSSRFLSPLHDSAVSIPSPIRRKSVASDGRKNRTLDDSGAVGGGLSPSSANSPQVDTLANHFEKERQKDLAQRRKDEKSRNGNDKERAKENHRPSFFSGSDKFRFPGKTSSNCSSFSPNSSPVIVPGRHSVDENVLYRRPSSRRYSDVFRDNLEPESANGSPKNPSFSSYSASTVSSRKSGKEVSSKYLNDLQPRPLKGRCLDSDQPVSLDSSPKANKFSIKKALKRTNSMTGYGSATSQWALSPGRSGSPPISLEHKGKLMSFSNLKPPSTPSKPKVVEKLWHMGVDYLFRGKKSSSSLTNFGLRFVNTDAIHQLRLLHNREMQWRYANARTDVVNNNTAKQTEINLVCTWDGIRKLQHSVLQKRLQVEKEKLKMKLNFILHSQVKLLETWGDMERQYLSAVSKTKECLHSAVCKVPLTEGAKMSPSSASLALVRASDLTASIQSTLTSFSPMVEEAVASLSELAEVVAQEKLLIEECCELFRTISVLEIEEMSLRCSAIQLNSWQKQPQQQ